MPGSIWIEGEEFRLDPHAVDRMRKHQVQAEDIVRVITSGAVQPSPHSKHKKEYIGEYTPYNRTMRLKVVVSYKRKRPLIVTVHPM